MTKSEYRCTDCGTTDPEHFDEPPCNYCGAVECLKCGGEVVGTAEPFTHPADPDHPWWTQDD